VNAGFAESASKGYGPMQTGDGRRTSEGRALEEQAAVEAGSEARATSLILETGSRAVFHTLLLFSLYIFFGGHNAPGGGFIGGLVAGGAFFVRYLALGAAEFRRMTRVHPEIVLGGGLLVAVGSGILALAYGEVFESAFVSFRLPVIGAVEIVTSLIFDAGVYLVVVGLVMTLIETIGGEAQP
jgi:multicomponent Na+:H+ antiporter subunit A